MASNENKKDSNTFYQHDDDSVESTTSERDNVSVGGDIKSPTSTVSTTKRDSIEQASRNKESASKGSLVSGRKGSKILKEVAGSSVVDKKESMELETKESLPSEEKESAVSERKGNIPSERKGSIVSERKGSNSSERKGIMFSDKNDIMVTEEKSEMGSKSKENLVSEKRGSIFSERRSSGVSEARSMRKKSNISRESSLTNRSNKSDTGSHISQVETRSLPLFPSEHDEDEGKDESKDINSKQDDEPEEMTPPGTRDETNSNSETLFKLFNKESKLFVSQSSTESRESKPLPKENDQPPQKETSHMRQKISSRESVGSVSSQKLHNSDSRKKISRVASKQSMQRVSEPKDENNVHVPAKGEEKPNRISDEKNLEEKTGDTLSLQKKPSIQRSVGEIKGDTVANKTSKHQVSETDSGYIAKKSPSKQTNKSHESIKGIATTRKSQEKIGQGMPIDASDEQNRVQTAVRAEKEMDERSDAVDTSSKHQLSQFTDENTVIQNTSRESIKKVDEKKEKSTHKIDKMEGDNIAHEMNEIQVDDVRKEDVINVSSHKTQSTDNVLVSGTSNVQTDNKFIDPNGNDQGKESPVQDDTSIATVPKTPSERKISPERENEQTQQPTIDLNSENAGKLSDGDDSLFTTVPKTTSKKELQSETPTKELSEFEFPKTLREMPEISEKFPADSDAATEKVRHRIPNTDSQLEVFSVADDTTGPQQSHTPSKEGEPHSAHKVKRRRMSATRLSKDGILETRQDSKHSGVSAAKEEKGSRHSKDDSDSMLKAYRGTSHRRQSKFSEALGMGRNESFMDTIAQDDTGGVRSEEGASRKLPRRRSKDRSSRAEQIDEPVAVQARSHEKSKTSFRKESTGTLPTLSAHRRKSSQSIPGRQNVSRDASRHESFSTSQGIPASDATEVTSDRLHSAVAEHSKVKTRKKSIDKLDTESKDISLSEYVGHGSEEFKKIPGTKDRRSSSNRTLRGSERKIVPVTESNKYPSQDTADELEGRVILPALSEAQRVKAKQRPKMDAAPDKEGPMTSTSKEHIRRSLSTAQRDTDKLPTFGTGEPRRKRSLSSTGRDVETDKHYETSSRDSGSKKGSQPRLFVEPEVKNEKYQYTPTASQVRRESRPYTPTEPEVKRERQKYSSFDSDTRRESRPSSVTEAKRSRETSRDRRISPFNEYEKFRYPPGDMDTRMDREYRGPNAPNIRREPSFHGDREYPPIRSTERDKSPYGTSVRVKPSRYPPIGSAADRGESSHFPRGGLDSAFDNTSAPKTRKNGSQADLVKTGKGIILLDYQPTKTSREKGMSMTAQKMDYVDNMELGKQQRGKRRSKDGSIPSGLRLLPTSKTADERATRGPLKEERKREPTTADTDSSSRNSSLKDTLTRERKSWFFKHIDYRKGSEGKYSKKDGLKSPANSPASDGKTPTSTPKSTSFDYPKPITRPAGADSAPHRVRLPKEAETQQPTTPTSTLPGVSRRSNIPVEGRQSVSNEAPERRIPDKRQSIVVQAPLVPEKKNQYEGRQSVTPSIRNSLPEKDVPVQVPYERRGPAGRPQAVDAGARRQIVAPGPSADRRQSAAPETSVNRRQNIAQGPTTDRRQSVPPGPATYRRQSAAPVSATERSQSVAPVSAAERRQSAAPVSAAERRQSAAPVSAAERRQSTAPVSAAERRQSVAPVSNAERRQSAAPVSAAERRQSAAPVPTTNRRQSTSPGPDRRQSVVTGPPTNRRQSVSAPQQSHKKPTKSKMISGQSPGDRKPILNQHALRGQAIAAYIPSETSSVSLSVDVDKDAPPKSSR